MRLGRRRAFVAAALAALTVPVAAFAQTPPVARADEMTFQAVVERADFPSNLAFAPDGRAFYAEKDTGAIRVIDASGALRPAPIATIEIDASANEMGLLGLALHPDFGNEPWIYAYYSGRDGRNHLARLRADGGPDAAPDELMTLLPTENGWHNGGDLAFAPDGTLYVAVGEGHVPDRAQDDASPGGKILRLEDDGSIPADNPFGADSSVYATGIRNSFGLCVAPGGTLWETENGPSEWDELNRIEPGANYGWPAHLGPGAADGVTPPVFAWRDVVVPTGCLVQRDGSILVGDFHGDLHRIAFPGDAGEPTDAVVATFEQGITDVERSPDGRLYVTTADGIWVRGARNAGRGPFTPAGIVILLALLGLLLLARSRLDRR